MTDPLYDSRNPNHGRSGGLLPSQPDITRDPRLPKAGLFEARLSRGRWMLARFRLSNAHLFFVGPFQIFIRAPWLEAPAKAHLALYASSSVPLDKSCGAT